MKNNLPFCFGVFTIFNPLTEKCERCELKYDCAKTTCTFLLNHLDNAIVKKVANGHLSAMGKLGLISKEEAGFLKNKDRQAKQKAKELLERTIAELSSQDIVSVGYISDDLSKAPEYFRVTTNFIRINEKTTQEQIYTNMKLHFPDSDASLVMTALAIQVLKHNKIIEINGQTVKWIGNKNG